MINKFTTSWGQNRLTVNPTYENEWQQQPASSQTTRRPDDDLFWTYEPGWSLQTQPSFYTTYGKRCLDVTISLVVVIFILSWLIPIIAAFIFFDSPGPFYFVQRRTGHNGKPFTCLKFRTMGHHMAQTEFRQTLKDDERVTRVGHFLRRTNLDEMLQFVNVLTGHMTLVGPRPHARSHDAQHWTSDQYRARYVAKPGITGLAQIRGARGATVQDQRMAHRVRYDHFYIRRQTFRLDMKICLATLMLTIKGDTNAW